MKKSLYLSLVVAITALASLALGCGEAETVTVVETVVVEKEVVKEVSVEKIVEVEKAEELRGGDLVVSLMCPMRKWDISMNAGVCQVSHLQRVYSPLLQVSPQSVEANYKIIPALAKSWSFNDTFDSVTVELYDGVKFHDGSPLTTDDIVYSLEQAKDPPENRPQPRGGGLRVISDIEVLDALSLRINLGSPSVDFVNELANPWQPVFKKAMLQLEGGINVPERAIGTGPFMVEEAVADEFVHTVSYPDYHHDAPDGKPFPYMDSVRSTFIRENATRIAAVETGQIDIAYLWGGDLGNALASEARMGQGGRLQRSTISAFYGLSLNGTKPPFDDIRARKAMYLAIDTQKIIDQRTQPGLPPVYARASFLGSTDPSMNDVPKLRVNDPAQREANIAEAKRLFAEAGVTELYIVSVSTVPLYSETTELLVQQLEDIGIEVDLEVFDGPGWSKTVSSGEYDAIQTGTAYLFPAPAYVMNITYNPEISRYIAPRPAALQPLLDRARSTPDGPKRVAIWKDVSKLIEEEWVPYVPMYGGYKDDFYLVRSYVQNYNGYFQTSRFHNNAFYNVWLDETKPAR